ncbi:hypothetical protein [Sphingosinicella rhizophila]|uniref:DUF308 domain-containing protein n=1 Tax=Sphingosinicella rhizophila TaxID=3050082 RepID=A0ABU3Q9U0_9SPHN|nr:hypothetical protein [Sphingosinicella sp. GR2756]MDT9600062.1 hypothetical protein [Sphingosinicella sp. GR2756]
MRGSNGGGGGGIPWRVIGWGGAALVLLLHFAAMQFMSEMAWSFWDFAFAGLILGGAGLVLELAVRASDSLAYRAGAGAAMLAAILLLWVNGAVGFLGDEDNPANLLFPGLIAIALLASAVARFRPAGMARAMFAAAGLQLLIGVVAVAAGLGAPADAGRYEAALGTVLFTFLWLLSAGLFRKAARA